MPRGGGESAAQPEAGRWRAVWRRHGRGIQRVATALFLLLVAALLVRQAALVEWQEVGQALAAYSLRVLLLAGLCATLSLAVYSLYEPLTQIYLVSWLRSQGQSSRPLPQPWRRLQLVALISHVFNLNLGALIGGLGLRIRLYSRMGLGKAQVAALVHEHGHQLGGLLPGRRRPVCARRPRVARALDRQPGHAEGAGSAAAGHRPGWGRGGGTAAGPVTARPGAGTARAPTDHGGPAVAAGCPALEPDGQRSLPAAGATGGLESGGRRALAQRRGRGRGAGARLPGRAGGSLSHRALRQGGAAGVAGRTARLPRTVLSAAPAGGGSGLCRPGAYCSPGRSGLKYDLDGPGLPIAGHGEGLFGSIQGQAMGDRKSVV